MCWLSWFSGPGFCSCPGFHLGLGASECSLGLAFCFTGRPLDLLPAAPHHPCKNRTHSTCFYSLAHQNRRIAIASDFRVDWAKSPEILQKEGVLRSEIAARNRKSLATFHRTLKSQCNIAFSCLGHRAVSGVRDGHRNRKSQKSLRFRCAKFYSTGGQHAEKQGSNRETPELQDLKN